MKIFLQALTPASSGLSANLSLTSVTRALVAPVGLLVLLRPLLTESVSKGKRKDLPPMTLPLYLMTTYSPVVDLGVVMAATVVTPQVLGIISTVKVFPQVETTEISAGARTTLSPSVIIMSRVPTVLAERVNLLLSVSLTADQTVPLSTARTSTLHLRFTPSPTT